MSQPVNGIRQNLSKIQVKDIQGFYKKYFVGQNFTISGAGNFDYNQFLQQIKASFGSITSKQNQPPLHLEKPYFTPSIMFIRDDQIPYVSVGVAFQVPTFNSPEYFAMNFFKKLIGSYRVDRDSGYHLNIPSLQYNRFHEALGGIPDLIVHQPYYFPYKDTALFCNFMYGNQVHNSRMLFFSQMYMSKFAEKVILNDQINEDEWFRARAQVFNELLNKNNPKETAEENAMHVSYLGRLVTRTQIAMRTSNMDQEYLKHVAERCFWDTNVSVVAWGTLHNVLSYVQYERVWNRSTCGSYGQLYITSL